MNTAAISGALAGLFGELVDGARRPGAAFILNSGDAGFLQSLDTLSAPAASVSVNEGATIAAHVQHVRYGLSLMNQWASEGGNPFANAKWDEAWTISAVDADQWNAIRDGVREESHRWLHTLAAPRDATEVEMTGLIASIAHLAYHLGAIRQIQKSTRGPKEGTFR
jgi:hypothetical protein